MRTDRVIHAGRLIDLTLALVKCNWGIGMM